MKYTLLDLCEFLTTIVAIVVVVLCSGKSFAQAPSGVDVKTDILVYESTPSGIVTAIAASREGSDVFIVSPYKHVGGMRTSGLSMPNLLHRETFGGFGREFHDRVYQYYVRKYGANSKQVRDCDGGFKFEPRVAETVFLDWLKEAGVKVLTEEYVVDVKKEGRKIVSVRTNRGRTIVARVYVDASYEGDLFAMAGVSYHIGRESRDTYGESLAGLTYPLNRVGEPSDKIQRYVYRLVLTDSNENQIPFRKPGNFHRATYLIDEARFRANPPRALSEIISLNRIPNRKTDVRVWEGWLGGSYKWPEASLSEREAIAKEHKDYAEGFLWFLLTDDSVPDAVKDELRKWGYARDEFVDNGNWPYQLYVREARRIIGDYVMTEHDIRTSRFKPDGIAVADFYIDVHPVQYVPVSGEVAAEGHSHRGGVVAEGAIWETIQPYDIPYRAMLPRRDEVENLIVPVCVSSSHIAYASIRMEPVYMAMGHAAGVAASMSIKLKRSLHDLPVDRLRKRLLAQGAVIDASNFGVESK